MNNIKGSIKLVLVFIVLAALIALIFLLAPENLKLPYPSEIFPK